MSVKLSERTRTALLPYGKQWLDETDIDAVLQVLQSDFITQGPSIQRFEEKVAAYAGVQYAVAFCNGTAALHGACYAAGLGEGDEVITTPITFLASSNSALYVGARPIFADIRMDTYNIDPDAVERKISSRTKAVIPVDFTGQPAEMDRIEEIARRHGLIVIHDAAHSLGASYKGRKVGSFGDMTMFSFHPVKHVTTGEGGIIVTNDKRYYDKLLKFRNHGMTRDPQLMTRNDGPWYYEMLDIGYNYRMTDMQAALGASQMNKLDAFVARRREIAAKYTVEFSRLPGVSVPHQHEGTDSSWHLYVLRWDKDKFDRAYVFEQLRERFIGVNVHYIPVYKQPYYQQLGYDDLQCPNAEIYYETCITLPLFPRMTDDDVEDVIAAVCAVHEDCLMKG